MAMRGCNCSSRRCDLVGMVRQRWRTPILEILGELAGEVVAFVCLIISSLLEVGLHLYQQRLSYSPHLKVPPPPQAHSALCLLAMHLAHVLPPTTEEADALSKPGYRDGGGVK